MTLFISVCLLSVLFLLPYCSRGHAPLLVSLGGWCVATYSFLVLPVLISANYKYPVRWLRQLMTKLIGKIQLVYLEFYFKVILFHSLWFDFSEFNCCVYLCFAIYIIFWNIRKMRKYFKCWKFLNCFSAKTCLQQYI